MVTAGEISDHLTAWYSHLEDSPNPKARVVKLSLEKDPGIGALKSS